MPDFNAQRSTPEREEVFLIKWTVCSYLHSSGERRRDINKFDSTGTTSKIKFQEVCPGSESPVWDSVEAYCGQAAHINLLPDPPPWVAFMW